MHYLIIVLLNSYEEDTGAVQEEVVWEGQLPRLPVCEGRLATDVIAASRREVAESEASEPLRFDIGVISISKQLAFHRTRIYLGSALPSHAERIEARRVLMHHFGFRREWALYGLEDPVCDDFEARKVLLVVDVFHSPFSPLSGRRCARLERRMELGGGHEAGWRIELTRPPRHELSLADDDFVTEMAAYFVMIEGVVPAWADSDDIVMASANGDLGVDPWRIASMLVTEYGFAVRSPETTAAVLVPVDGVQPPGPGDIVEIPLTDGRYGYARYDRYTENDGSLVTILRVTAERMVEPETLAATDPAFGPIHTGIIHSVLTGRWRVVGHVKVPDPLPTCTFRHWEAPRYGRAGGWDLYVDGEFTQLGPKLPRAHRNLEMLWLWPCEDLEHRIMTGTSPHLERMREFE